MPTPPDEQPTADTPATATPAAREDPAAGAPPPSAPPPTGPPPGYPMFGPVPRAPRIPWINPDRRAHLLAAAIVAALILLGAGFGIGYAAAPSRDHHQHLYRGRYEPVLPGGYGPGRWLPGPRHLHPPVPGNPNATPATPAPSNS